VGFHFSCISTLYNFDPVLYIPIIEYNKFFNVKVVTCVYLLSIKIKLKIKYNIFCCGLPDVGYVTCRYDLRSNFQM
jgi:hypothetical protein